MSVLPPDPRALPTFEIIRGEETMWRRDYKPADAHESVFGDLPDEVLVGQPVRLLGTDGKCFVINDTDTERTGTVTSLVHEVIGTIHPTIGSTDYEEQLLGISFTHFTKLLSGGGEPSATENELITVVSGHFVARIKHATWFSATPVTGMAVQVINVDSTVNEAKFRGLDMDADDLATALGVSDAAGAVAIAEFINCVGKVLTVSGDYCEVEFTI